ncbi:MAG: ketopantoate reductase family protein [Chloroflexi bacterium]|nr:MAG: ketopantoate reductase family protein [Chloroflexota bacterium]
MTDSTRNLQPATGNFHLLVIGAGAIGCLVGGKLAQAGVPVTLAGRQRFVDAVTANGLRLISDGVTQRIDAIHPVASLEAAYRHAVESGRPFDAAILTVKSYDTATALAELREAAQKMGLPMPPILSLQNGVGNEEAIAAACGPQCAIAGTITAPVEIAETGVVRLTKPKFLIGMARWDQQNPAPIFAALYHQLLDAAIPVTLYADARSLKWTKLLMNQIGNATSAILAQPPAVTFAHKAIADLEISALRETLGVMAAAGIRAVNVEKYPLCTLAPLLRYAPRWLLRPLLRQIVSGARGGKMPSLYLDLEAGKRENEVVWYNGAVVRAGETLGVATPVNRLLSETVLHLVRYPDEREIWRGAVERLSHAVR